MTQVWTDDEGQFERILETFCPNQDVQIHVSSRHQPSPGHIVVFDRANIPSPYISLQALIDDLTVAPQDYKIYSQVVDTFVPSIDAPLPSGHDISATLSGNLATGIHITRTARQSLDYFDAWTNLGSLVHMNILYDSDEVVQNGDGIDCNYNFYIPTVHPGMIHIVPNSGWAGFTIAHEMGHVFHHFFARNHGPGVSNPPYGRFGESMCHTHAAGIRKNTFMSAFHTMTKTESLDYNGKYLESLGGAQQAQMDFYATPASAAASLNCNTPPLDACCAFPTLAERGNCALAHGTGWDWRIFYDLLDDNSIILPEPVDEFIPVGGGLVSTPNFDGVNGNFNGHPGTHLIMDVVVNYLGRAPNANPQYVDRGQVMLDVVDVLDGMSCRGHMSISAAQDLLHEAMGYDYDFASNGVPCP